MMDYPKISIDKVDQEIHQFAQTPAAQPVVQQPTTPVAPPPRTLGKPPVATASAPEAKDVNVPSMVKNVTENYGEMQKQMPEPKVPITGAELLAAVGLLGLGGMGLNKILGEKEGPPTTPKSIGERKIGAGPQMDVNTSEPRLVGGLFPENVSTRPLPENPPVPLTTEVGNPPKEMNLVQQSKKNAESKQLAKDIKVAEKAIVPPPESSMIRTGSGMPAYQGTAEGAGKIKKVMTSLADVPKDKVFVPEGQYMDILRNAVGQEAYTANLSKHGYPATPEVAYSTASQINRDLGRLSREEAKAAGTALGEPTKAITHKVGGAKAVKVGGVVGALISMSDLAKAENLRQGVSDVAEGLLPIGITPTGTNTNEAEELARRRRYFEQQSQKLGSPFRAVPPPR